MYDKLTVGLASGPLVMSGPSGFAVSTAPQIPSTAEGPKTDKAFPPV